MVTLGDFHITSDQGLLKDTQGYFRDTSGLLKLLH